MHYPVSCSRYTVQRLREADWQQQSPTLVLRAHTAELHIPQVKQITAKRVMERKHDPDLVTVAVDLNVKNLAVITARAHGTIMVWMRTVIAISSVLPGSSGSRASQSKVSTATSSSGGMWIG